MNYYAKDYGILPNEEVAESLSRALNEMSKIEGEKTLIFEKGLYYLDSDKCEGKMLYITNTAGDKEFKDNETPHFNKIGINFQNIKDLTFQGNGAEFLIDGRVTNIAVENCENITIDGITIDVKNPPLHEFTVDSVNGHSVVFSLEKNNNKYVEEKGKYYLFGKGYKENFFENRELSWWNAQIKNGDTQHVERVRHPFAQAFSIKEIAPYKFKLKYLSTKRFGVGDKFYVFNTRRQFAGIFVNKTKNFTLKNTAQHFNYSLALVCQDTENITVDNVNFAPKENSGGLIASLADFIQICTCKGKVSVTNSYFCGACDDAINVHGIHMYIDKIEDNKLTLKFRHPQTHGFNPFHDGDEIEYVDRHTLECVGKAKIVSSELASEHIIEMLVDNTENAKVGQAIEDITMCPDLYYANNTLDRIITRNILVTTRGKVVIENNKFLNSTMASILLSDDAKSWYESGPCYDVTIKGNYFGTCRSHFVQILPENRTSKNVIHKNINIVDNIFDSEFDKGIDINRAENVTISGNEIKSSACKSNFVKVKDSINIVNEF